MSEMDQDYDRDEDEKISKLCVWEDPVDGTKTHTISIYR